MAEVAASLDPGADWETIQETLPFRFEGKFDTREHYERVVECWRAAETYRAAVDALLDDDGSPRADRREAAAEAGEAFLETLGEGSFGIAKLDDTVYGLFRALGEGRDVVTTQEELTEDGILDLVRNWYGWVGEEQYVPALQIATYREEDLYADRTLIERAWLAEEDRVARNRLAHAFDVITSESATFDHETRQWVENLHQRLETAA